MASIDGLTIVVETPDRITGIDLGAIASHLGRSVAVIADGEGTLVEWGRMAVPEDILDWARDGFSAGSLAVMSMVTNRGGAGGSRLCLSIEASFASVSTNKYSGYRGEQLRPARRSERKPSGTMTTKVVERHLAHGIPACANVMVGDKPSDMFEAQAAGLNLGFMVAKLGERDHPLDTRFGKRKAASEFREQLRQRNPNQRFVRQVQANGQS